MIVRPLPILNSEDVPIDALMGKTVSIIGYGNQGRAHALNLRDSGIAVSIATRNQEYAYS